VRQVQEGPEKEGVRVTPFYLCVFHPGGLFTVTGHIEVKPRRQCVYCGGKDQCHCLVTRPRKFIICGLEREEVDRNAERVVLAPLVLNNEADAGQFRAKARLAGYALDEGR
jgi:hypothetical protein